MCGAYYIDDDTYDDIRKIIHSVDQKIHTGTIRPGSKASVIVERDHCLHTASMKWGFPGIGSQLMFYARSETAFEKKTFSESMMRRRCIIPAKYFFEWDRQKNKAQFSMPDNSVMLMAGFYNMIDNKDHFVILTTQANASMLPVHDRMPLLLAKDQIDNWLCDASSVPSILVQSSPELSRYQEYEQLSFL